jgi:F-type H+-transporting ATPase subunit epsilon
MTEDSTQDFSTQDFMHLKNLLPFQVFLEKKDISRIVAETSAGSIGLLPHRLDFVAVLEPGIFVYENEGEGEVYLAVDEGIMIKTGMDVLVSVRNAIRGKELSQLREAVEKEFLTVDEREKNMHSVMAKLESGIIRRFVEFYHD